MDNQFYHIEFDSEGVHYIGRLSAEKKDSDGSVRSWHVVLNDVFFGYLNKDNGHWESSEQRPHALTEQVGKLIDGQHFKKQTV